MYGVFLFAKEGLVFAVNRMKVNKFLRFQKNVTVKGKEREGKDLIKRVNREMKMKLKGTEPKHERSELHDTSWNHEIEWKRIDNLHDTRRLK